MIQVTEASSAAVATARAVPDGGNALEIISVPPALRVRPGLPGGYHPGVSRRPLRSDMLSGKRMGGHGDAGHGERNLSQLEWGSVGFGPGARI